MAKKLTKKQQQQQNAIYDLLMLAINVNEGLTYRKRKYGKAAELSSQLVRQLTSDFINFQQQAFK